MYWWPLAYDGEVPMAVESYEVAHEVAEHVFKLGHWKACITVNHKPDTESPPFSNIDGKLERKSASPNTKDGIILSKPSLHDKSNGVARTD